MKRQSHEVMLNKSLLHLQRYAVGGIALDRLKAKWRQNGGKMEAKLRQEEIDEWKTNNHWGQVEVIGHWP